MLKTLHITTVDLTAYCFLRSRFRLLRRRGHRVALATTVERFGAELEPVTDELFPLHIPRRIRPAADARALGQLLHLIGRYRPQLVHTYTSKAGFLGRLAARLSGVPLVLHTIYELPQNATTRPFVRGLYRSLEKLAAGWCDHLVTISQINQEQILREGICAPEKLSLITEGLELDRYVQRLPADQLRQTWGVPAGAPLIGMAARLERAKGHADLFEAFRQLLTRQPDAWLVLFGRGELQADLEQRAGQLGIGERVRFIGWVDDLPSALGALDLFVLSSHYEGLGLVLLEALAMGTPVVSTRVGGTQDIVEHERTGLFAPARAPGELAQAMLRMLQDRELAGRLAAAGQARVREHYRAETCDAQLVELYERLWSTKSRE